MVDHTPEPWKLDRRGLPTYSEGMSLIFHSPWREEAFDDSPLAKANWARIVMCVNACSGMPDMPDMQPGSVKMLMDALEKQITEWEAFKYTGYVPPEDGDARYYAEEAVSNCADELKELLREALRELGEEM